MQATTDTNQVAKRDREAELLKEEDEEEEEKAKLRLINSFRGLKSEELT